MPNMLFANNCNTTLNGSITAVATSMVVTSATGFPSPTGSQYFYCTLADAATQTTIEIVKVTAVSGTTFTIVRGQDGTTGTIFASGAVVSLRLVRASLNDFPKLDENNTFTQLQTINTIGVSGSTSTTPVLSFNASNCPIASGTSISGSYLQFVLQNTSGTAGASTNYVLSNDLGTDSTYYGEFGMNSSVYSSGTPADFFSINNGIYFSGHDGDVTVGSGNGKKLYLAWGTSGQSAHVINASGAIGLNTNLASGTGSGTTNFGTAGQVLTSQGSSATPTWTSVGTGTVTSVAASVPSFLSISGSPITTSGTLAISYSGTALPVANGGTGLTSLTAGYIPYGNGTSAFASSSGLFFDGTNLGIGTSSPSVKLQVQAASVPEIRTTDGTNIFQVYSDTTNGGAVMGVVNNAPLVLRTNATERMRIDSSGNLLVGTTAITSGVTTSQLYVKRIGTQTTITADQTGGTGGYNYTSNATNNGGVYYHFNFLEATTSRGSITSNGTVTIYATTSDYRLKENVKPMVGALATVAQLKPVTYDWTENKVSGQGFIAHELQSVIPDAVVGGKDAVDSEGNAQYQQIDTSVLVATLTAAIQEQQAMIENLTTRLNALEGK